MVLLATTMYVRADSQQKLLGSPASEQRDQPEAHRDMTDLMVVWEPGMVVWLDHEYKLIYTSRIYNWEREIESSKYKKYLLYSYRQGWNGTIMRDWGLATITRPLTKSQHLNANRLRLQRTSIPCFSR